MTPKKKRYNYRLRLQAYENTPNGMLLEYLTSLGSQEATSLIFRHLRMALLPLAYQDLGELSPEQLRLKVLEATNALEEYVSSIRQRFCLERQQQFLIMPTPMLSNSNANSNDNSNGNSNGNGHSGKAFGSDELDEEDDSESIFLEGDGTIADCDELLGAFD